eukprot:CAMPEP_0184695884 /NCGR_PEP_ID=MMETSP0313-20130426/3369_1 /TAXON_ID=2792 /ORGANISM="Porphyridium aerugineum, Strain SAG 1380-2" /LENGTH=774 /DNA_ID=CAMNT_0027154411 /DNA_START=238 /DNA_END=2562 /DNA_ORIENTATION=-
MDPSSIDSVIDPLHMMDISTATTKRDGVAADREDEDVLLMVEDSINAAAVSAAALTDANVTGNVAEESTAKADYSMAEALRENDPVVEDPSSIAKAGSPVTAPIGAAVGASSAVSSAAASTSVPDLASALASSAAAPSTILVPDEITPAVPTTLDDTVPLPPSPHAEEHDDENEDGDIDVDAAAGGAQGGAADATTEPKEYVPFVLTPEQEELVNRKLKKEPKPSQENLNKQVEAIKVSIQQCFDRLNQTRDAYDQKSKIQAGFREEFTKAKKELDRLMQELMALIEKKKQITAQINELKEKDGGGKQGSDSKAGGSSSAAAGQTSQESGIMKGIKTMEDLDRRIQELEEKQVSHTMKIADEKRLIQDLAFLKHKGRAQILENEGKRQKLVGDREARRKQRDELEALRKQQDVKIDEAQAKVDAQRVVVDAIKQRENNDIGAVKGIIEKVDRDVERKKIAELKAEINRLYDEHRAAMNVWAANDRLHREQQRLKKKVQFEKIRAEREAKRLEREAEAAKFGPPDPYAEQKDMCDNLIAYLVSLVSPEEAEALGFHASAASKEAAGKAKFNPLATTTTVRQVETKGKRIGKSENDELDSKYSFQGKKKGGKGSDPKPAAVAAPVSAPADTKLASHPMDRFVALQKLGISPPVMKSEIAQTIELLKQKRAYYESAPADAEVTKTASKTASMSKTKSGGKSSSERTEKDKDKDFVLDDKDIPSLVPNGVPVSSPTADPSKPSFSDIIRGKGHHLPAHDLKSGPALGEDVAANGNGSS